MPGWTKERLAEIFEEWKRRYDADPEGFQSHEAFQAESPQSYGDGAARYFLYLIGETMPEGYL